MLRPLAAFALAISLAISASAHPHQAEAEAAPQTPSPFIGRYDGSAMETASGMIVRANGTFTWGLSVGGLDLREQGKWSEEDGEIVFASDPKPVPPEFRWTGTANLTGEPLLKVQLPDGRELEYVDIRIICGESVQFHYQIPETGLKLKDEGCEELNAILLEMPGSNMEPQAFVLSEQGWSKGQTILFEFRRNDLGVLDFDGIRGRLCAGKLTLQGPMGTMELRKLEAEPPQQAHTSSRI